MALAIVIQLPTECRERKTDDQGRQREQRIFPIRIRPEIRWSQWTSQSATLLLPRISISIIIVVIIITALVQWECPLVLGSGRSIDVSCQVYNYILLGPRVIVLATHIYVHLDSGLSCPDIMSLSLSVSSYTLLKSDHKAGAVFSFAKCHTTVYTLGPYSPLINVQFPRK